jgi:4-amino-4-deoxy-L-arabinose transferase-like glycosyltransferase
MREAVRHQWIIAAVAFVVFFANLGATRLWDQDEAFFARAAVEMHQRNDWVVPYFNGEVFAHKPPFMFWMMRTGFVLFGVNEFAARFWSAVFAVGTALLSYRIGARMFNSKVGLWAGLAISTSLMFDVVGRAASPDSFLVFFCTLALYVFVQREDWKSDGEDKSNETSPALSWLAFATMYAAMGIAVLVKGPIGVLLPGCVIGLYLLIRNPIKLTNDTPWSDRTAAFLSRFTPNKLLRTFWKLRPFTAIAAILVVAGPWYVIVGWRTGGSFLSEFFGEQNLSRFLNPMDNHSGGVWYYLPAMIVGFFPWSVFTIPTVLNLVSQCRTNTSSQRGAKFVASWAIVWVGFFSLASTKLPSYVLPAYPALALATGCLLHRWQQQLGEFKLLWPRLSFGSLIAVGATMAIAAPAAATLRIGGQTMLEKLGLMPELASDFAQVGWLGLILVSGGIACMILAERKQMAAALKCFAVTAPVFSLGLFAVLAVKIDRLQPCPSIAESIHRYASEPHVAQFGFFRPSLIYYSDTRVEACKTVPSISEFLDRNHDSFVVTTEAHYNKLAAQLPANIVVLDRAPEFPRAGNVVLLGRQPKIAAREEPAKN